MLSTRCDAMQLQLNLHLTVDSSHKLQSDLVININIKINCKRIRNMAAWARYSKNFLNSKTISSGRRCRHSGDIVASELKCAPIGSLRVINDNFLSCAQLSLRGWTKKSTALKLIITCTSWVYGCSVHTRFVHNVSRRSLQLCAKHLNLPNGLNVSNSHCSILLVWKLLRRASAYHRL